MDEPQLPPKRIRKRPSIPANPHADMMQLVAAMQRLADTLEPLGDYVPVLVEMAKTWNAAATTGKTLGRGALWVSSFGKWLGGVAIFFAILWLLIHQKWEALLAVVLK